MILAVILSGLISCGGDKLAQESLITVDVTENYPKKEFILQDIMDVEYIPLVSTDSFITRGKLMDVGKNILILSNTREGDILIFDRTTGQGLKAINHRGQGAEEYLMLINVILDEANGELFANDGPSSKIQVYDMDGNFKRTLQYRKGAFVSNIYNYDKDHLLCQDTYAPENTDSKHSFFLLSKQDGTIENIQIPYEEKISTVIVKKVGDMVYGNAPRNSLITPVQDKWILTEPSTDTIYMSGSHGDLHPFMVRTPSVRTMDPEIFLFPGVLTSRYYFLQAVKKECDFEKNQDMPKTDLVFDKQENRIYQYTVYNKDFNKRIEDMSARCINGETAFYVTLEANELVEAYKKGRLDGPLKVIATKLNEEDNPVIMIVKPKK